MESTPTIAASVFAACLWFSTPTPLKFRWRFDYWRFLHSTFPREISEGDISKKWQRSPLQPSHSARSFFLVSRSIILASGFLTYS